MEDNKTTIGLNAEKVILGGMLGDINQSDAPSSSFIETPDLPESYSISSNFIQSPNLPEPTQQTYQRSEINDSDSNLRVNYVQTGIDYTVPMRNDADLNDKVLTLEDSLNNVSKTMMDAFQSINKKSAEADSGDKFEERVTVLPNNLIYNNRVSRTVEKPTWA
jgi:hypothetical protein